MRHTRVERDRVAGAQVPGLAADSEPHLALHHQRAHRELVRMRLGKLVITAAPGVRRQYANDYLLSDWLVARGYAYASTDKGNNGTNFQSDGVNPGDAIAEWHRRVTELTIAAKEVVRQRYGSEPAFTYMTGLSNGGYLTRYALENRPDLYDGGMDWEGVLWTADGPDILTSWPPRCASIRITEPPTTARHRHAEGRRSEMPSAHRTALVS